MRVRKRNKEDQYFELYSPDDDETILNLSYLKFINIPSILNVLEKRYSADKFIPAMEILISNPFANRKSVKNITINLDIPYLFNCRNGI